MASLSPLGLAILLFLVIRAAIHVAAYEQDRTRQPPQPRRRWSREERWIGLLFFGWCAGVVLILGLSYWRPELDPLLMPVGMVLGFGPLVALAVLIAGPALRWWAVRLAFGWCASVVLLAAAIYWPPAPSPPGPLRVLPLWVVVFGPLVALAVLIAGPPVRRVWRRLPSFALLPSLGRRFSSHHPPRPREGRRSL